MERYNSVEDEESTGGKSDDSSDDYSYAEYKPVFDVSQKEKQSQAVVERETLAVKRLKIVVLIVLSVPTLVIACVVYFYTSSVEKSDFQTQFNNDGMKLLSGLGKSFDNSLVATESLAIAMVSFAKSANMTWPFVTLPDFAIRSSITRKLADTVIIFVYPMVAEENRYAWEEYVAIQNFWMNESLAVQEQDKNFNGPIIRDYEIWDVIHDYTEYEKEFPGLEGTNRTPGPYYPTWQQSPFIPTYPPTNWDLGGIQNVDFIDVCMKEHYATITYPYLGGNYVNATDPTEIEEMWYEADWIKDFIDPELEADEPVSDLVYPIIAQLDGSNVEDGDFSPSMQRKAVGMLSVTFYWRALMDEILTIESRGVIIVIESDRDSFTYMIDGPKTVYLGVGDQHQTKYDGLMIESSLLDLLSPTYTGVPISREYCPYHIRVYPSDLFREEFTSSQPVVLTIVAVLIFAIFNFFVFLTYDKLVQRRNNLLVRKANRSRAFLTSLFPANIRDQLYGEETEDEEVFFESPSVLLKSFLDDECQTKETTKSNAATKPISEVFPDTTVMFGDIVGFTAWSSVREPSLIFKLLESLFSAFDKIAARKGIFKVETIGDCYVAVSGLPEPRKNHAVVMARFANACLIMMKKVTSELEVSCGPETGDLKMRFGLHSGSVIAGVLRGDKARFQLFGDTVNTTAHIESTGVGSKIHVSKKTADLLIGAGKENWVTKRTEMTFLKGKGRAQTFFVNVDHHCDSGTSNNIPSELDESEGDPRLPRHINWMLDVFGTLLKNIILHRPANSVPNNKTSDSLHRGEGETVRDEIVEIIELPEFSIHDGQVPRVFKNADEIDLSDDVLSQIRSYITTIACWYRNNPFHNFKHACQVTMATKKLLSRVVAPNDVLIEGRKDLHNCTYGITSDPLTQFAVVFAALIHDVDHPGVSNQQLVEVNAPVALQYNNKSVSEQNSVDLAWELLTRPAFSDLLACICSDTTELKRFRQLVVNAVMATDIFDKELKAFRDSRWDRAFDKGGNIDETPRTFSNRRATIVIEHVIQASDIAHCMQHWKVYCKWNRYLFEEMYSAYKEGWSKKNPVDGWYKGELWFFDNYIIPLAKKLKECGVFGVSCDEFLECAIDNRLEWQEKGHSIVSDMLAAIQKKEGMKFSQLNDKSTHSDISHISC